MNEINAFLAAIGWINDSSRSEPSMAFSSPNAHSVPLDSNEQFKVKMQRTRSVVESQYIYLLGHLTDGSSHLAGYFGVPTPPPHVSDLTVHHNMVLVATMAIALCAREQIGARIELIVETVRDLVIDLSSVLHAVCMLIMRPG